MTVNQRVAESFNAVFSLDELPTCDQGVMLAQGFLESCVRALESGDAAEFGSRFQTYVIHRRSCETCDYLSPAVLSGPELDVAKG